MIYAKLFILLFFLRTSTASTQVGLDQQDSTAALNTSSGPPLINRSVGIRNPVTSSHLNSIIIALFNIPTIQRKFFEAADNEIKNRSLPHLFKNSYIFLNAYNFSKLKLLQSTFDLNAEYIEFCRKVFKNHGIAKVSISFVDLYWINVLESLPKNISDAFKFNVTLSKCIPGQPENAATKEYDIHYQNVGLESHTTFLSDYINHNGPIPLQKRTVKMNSNGNSVEIQVRYDINSKPEVFTVRVKRFLFVEDGKVKFDRRTLLIDEKLKLAKVDETYVLVSRIVYDPDRGTFVTYSRDFDDSKWYKHNVNGTIELAQFEMIDYYSVLLFYVPESSFNKAEDNIVQVPDVFYNILGIDKPVNKPQKRKIDEISEEEFVITPEEAERWKSIYKPELSRYPEKYRGSYDQIVREVTMKMRIWPDEVVNCFAKIAFRVYDLGSEEYSFKVGLHGFPYTSLEFVLSALASDMKIVSKLFKMFTLPNLPQFESEVALVLARMLFGCKNIPLEKIVFLIGEKVATNFFFVLPLARQIDSIISMFNNEIIEIPKLKRISFLNMETDDPMTISTWNEPQPIIARNLTPLRPMTLKNGIYLDSKSSKSMRRRDIYKSTSQMFKVDVSRDKMTQLDGHFQEFGGSDYVISGVICNDPIKHAYYAFYYTDFKLNYFLRMIPGYRSDSFLATPENSETFKEAVRVKSLTIFFRRKVSNEELKNVKKSAIAPKELLTRMLRSYAEEFLNLPKN